MRLTQTTLLSSSKITVQWQCLYCTIQTRAPHRGVVDMNVQPGGTDGFGATAAGGRGEER